MADARTTRTARNVTVRPSRGPRPALWYYRHDVAILRVMWNWFWLLLAKYAPWFRLKSFFLRRTGMTVHKGVALGYAAQPDLLFPQDITLEDDVTIGYNTTILCHGYLRDRVERGPVRVCTGAAVGADCTVLAGVTIGPGAVVAAKSLVNRDIPAHEVWGGVPAKRLGHVDDRLRPIEDA